MKMKKWCCLLLTLLLLAGTALADENLLVNGDFEILDGLGQPSAWFTDAWYTQIGITEYTVDEGRSGNAAVVANYSPNDARFAQAVQVEPNSTYCLSGYIKAAGIPGDQLGANLSISGVYAFSEMVYETEGEWQYVELYGKTGPSQNTVTVLARLGGYSGENSGWAAFDDLKLVKVNGVPSGHAVAQWYTTSGSVATTVAKSEEDNVFWPYLALIALVWAFLAPLLARGGEKTKKTRTVLFIAFGVAVVPGYSVDISCFQSWSNTMFWYGPAGFYENAGFCDYPPACMLLLWPVGALLNLFGDAAARLVVVKALPVLLDLGAAAALYFFAEKRNKANAGLAAALLVLFSPAIVLTGAGWGQYDSVMTFVLLLCVLFAAENRWRVALPLYMLSVLIKPQALMFGPVGVAALVLAFVREKENRATLTKQTLQGLGLTVLTAAVVLAPFCIGREKPIGWIVGLYSDTLSSYDYAVLNVANLFYLLGGNWVGADTVMQMQFPMVTGLLFVLGAAGLYVKQQGRSGIARYGLPVLLLLTGCAFIGAAWSCTYALYGTIMMAAAFLYGFYLLFAGKKAEKLPWIGALVLILIYALGVKMHERYLYPALILLAASYVLTEDRRLLKLLVGFSATTFINIGIVLYNSILYGASMGHLNSDTVTVADLTAVVNLLLAAYACYVGYTGLPGIETEANNVKEKPNHLLNDLLHPAEKSLRVTRAQALCVAAVTVAYGALTFCNLGSTKAPQTAWIAGNPGETVTVELDESRTFEALYYCPVTYNGFTVAVSEDGENWSVEYPCAMDQGQCYHWKYVVESYAFGADTSFTTAPLRLTGKYFRVTAPNAGTSINEFLLRDPETKENVPIISVSGSNTNPNSHMLLEYPAENLCDEQDTLDGEPSWYNSMYFDEIYHGRTAYEHAKGLAPYETTHPPLGKVFMSWAVMIFGMTPFGWRFAGNLAGVLMLPAMYFLVRQLTRRHDLSLAAMLLLTFDTFHFTQCRLATIDSFPTLFIIFSYAFMIRYMAEDFFDGKVWKHWAPLALSGLCMGLGIACKWTGLYSAVGLAVLFFYHCGRQLMTANEAAAIPEKQLPAERREAVAAAKKHAFTRVLITCCACLAFFIAVPALIYYLSYIPYLSPTGKVTIERIIQAQEGMFNYHNTPGLGADHPYQSPWWEWPLVIKPMWYYSSTYNAAGMGSTIFAIGNPAVWWTGLAAMAVMVFTLIRRHFYGVGGCPAGLRSESRSGEKLPLYVFIGFLSQYLPWVLVPRSTYIYHYFASVPFLICAIVWWLGRVGEQHPRMKWLLWLPVILAAILFIGFYPYASGVSVPTAWLRFMQWFPRIYF